MHHVVLAPSNQPPSKPLRLAYARHVLEEIVPSFQALPKDRCLDDPVGIFGTAARFSKLECAEDRGELACVGKAEGRA
jgi:hypothetical protein